MTDLKKKEAQIDYLQPRIERLFLLCFSLSGFLLSKSAGVETHSFCEWIQLQMKRSLYDSKKSGFPLHCIKRVGLISPP